MKKKTGFTLIELMVAVTIGMLVIGLGSVALNNFNEKQKVETARQEFIANLRLARSYAVTNQIPANSPKETDRVAVTLDNNGLMTIKAQKNDNTDIGYSFFSKIIESKNVSITIDNPIKFTVSDGRSINGTINIAVKGDDGTTKNIKIDESGLIYEQ